jgi:integrase
LLPDFGELALEAVTTQRSDAWRVELVAAGGIADGEGLSARTINKYLGVMHSILKRAQRVYGLTANAAAWAERQPVSRSGDFEVLSAVEVEALARAAREGRHRKPPKHPTGLEWRARLRQQDQQDAAIFLTAAYAGLRLGELRSLRWRDLDFAKRLIHVRHSYVMRSEDAPKSGRVRSVPMIDQVATALDQLSRRNGWAGEEDLVRQPDRRSHRGLGAPAPLLRRPQGGGARAHPLPRPPPQLRHPRRPGLPPHRRQGLHGPCGHRDDDDLRPPRPAGGRG